MRILHISDLHVTPPTTLSEIWAPVEACLLAEDKFDFIVVSGDLSKSADPSEFTALAEFLSEELLKRRLKESARARIILVPGNHDVLWSDAHFKSVLQGHDTVVAVESVKKDPHLSNYRLQFTDVGTLQPWEINQVEYPKRLANVQEFMDDFYGTSLADKFSRKFTLLAPGNEWSCHAFLDQSIAFVGLNSCDRNDKHWHGAGFNARALDAAARHLRDLREVKPNLFVVAVWHHGFISDISRPDRLALGDVGRLYNMGARLGLHGHTHLADTQHHELLGGGLRILATGSLAAGGGDLPDRTSNQFSIVELDAGATHVNVDTFHLDYQRQYRPIKTKTYALAAASTSPRIGSVERSSCDRHRRVCKINADGVKHVTIEMHQLLPFGRVQLALAMPPFGSSSSRERVLFANEPHEVVDKRLAGGKHRYAVDDLKSKLGNLSWQYDVSNSVALTQEELLLLPSRADSYPNIMPDEDACAFVPTFACGQLELEAQFESAPEFERARALVERRADHGSTSEWQVDELETAQVAKAFSCTRNADKHNVLSLIVKQPQVDCRYSLVFAPGREGRPYPNEAKFLAKDVLRNCRAEHFEQSALRATLTLAIGVALSEQLGGEIGEWVGHLWHAEDRTLLAAFGDFPSFGWGSSFEAGSGIAGHAFRHSAVVGWCSDVQGFTQTVYRKSQHVPGHGAPEYSWVLCLPLRLGAQGPAIGVVGFARIQSETTAEKCCEEYVRSLAEQPKGNDELMVLLGDLLGAVNIAFWTVLGQSAVLTQKQRSYAQAKAEEFQQPATPSARP